MGPVDVFRLQAPKVLIALLVYLEVALQVLPKRVQVRLFPAQVPASPTAKLLQRPSGEYITFP